jgi:4-amino-4-deoxy-L-arabinose transferase-like glycosyltransferase
MGKKMRFLGRIISVAATLGSPVTAFAQSCAMCYTTASAAKANAIQALKSGILVLLLPSFVVLGIGAVTFRSRDRFNDGPGVDEE